MATCYYEVLCVDKDATDADLKKAYRKLALIWHPDKNPDNSQEATHKFSSIQHAYEILSDPQERAWYDSHRELILNGGDAEVEVAGDGGLTTNDIMPYFSPSCYSGFTDNETGFYSTYASLFLKISLNEPSDLPEFGKADWDYISKVKPFYDFWQSFSTNREFGWFDKYKASDAPDRRIRRIIEKDNKKLRDAARKEYSATVRRLVQYLFKRDPRHMKYSAELEHRNKAKKKERESSSLPTRTKKEPPTKKINNIPSWAQFDESDLAELDQICAEWENETDLTLSNLAEPNDSAQEILEDLYCVACDIDFLSSKQLELHRKSKKHIKNVGFLREQLLQEECKLTSVNLDTCSNESKIFAPDTHLRADYCSMDAYKEDLELATDSLPVDFIDNFQGLNIEEPFFKIPKKKNKKKKVINTFSLLEELDFDSIGEEEAIPKKADIESNGDLFGSEPLNIASSTHEESNSEQPSIAQLSGAQNIKNKKNKRSKAKSSASDLLSCQVCHSLFTSRNQLFKHLKDTGHEKHISSKRR